MELSDLNLPFIQFQKKDFRRACFFIVKIGSGLDTKIYFIAFTIYLIESTSVFMGTKGKRVL